MNELKVMVAKGAFLPERKTEGAAGYDLYSPIDFTIGPATVHGRAANVGRYMVDLGVAIELDPGYVAMIKGRSGLARDNRLDVFEGTIDSDYRGFISVILYNYSAVPVSFKKGDRIAQLIIQKVEMPVPVKVKSLSDTARGAGGFGHTGK